MKLNDDLTKRAQAKVSDLPWAPSPVVGVKRKMLDRNGEEIARATTIVQFEKNKSFPEHTHWGGEEFFVLKETSISEDGKETSSGSFIDDLMEYKVGYYVRHPINSKHAPYTSEHKGCLILVKLMQMTNPSEQYLAVDTGIYDEPEQIDQNNLNINSKQDNAAYCNSLSSTHMENGVKLDLLKGKWEQVNPFRYVMKLFKDEREEVTLEKWLPGCHMSFQDMTENESQKGGEEILVIKGQFQERRYTQGQSATSKNPLEEELFDALYWIRIPSIERNKIHSRCVPDQSSTPCIIYRKVGTILP